MPGHESWTWQERHWLDGYSRSRELLEKYLGYMKQFSLSDLREFRPERIWEALYEEYVRLLKAHGLAVPRGA